MFTIIREIWLALLVLCAVLLMVGAWGLAAAFLVGFAVNPDALRRSMDDGSATWPWQVAIVLVLLVVGAGALLLTRRAVRRWKAPRPAIRPKATRARRATRQDRALASQARREELKKIRAENEGSVSLRSKLFLLAALVLAIAAVFAGMIGEWRGVNPQGFTGPGSLLAIATLGASFVLGVAFAGRLKVGRAVRATNPLHADDDLRPVLALIWWPITIVAVVVPILVVYFAATRDIDAGSGLPTGITLVVGVFGFISLPAVVSESVAEFGGRRLRGFWRAAKNTEWGDGGA
jgi:hypothetical protein